MKKYQYNTMIIALLAVVFSSCESFIDIDPPQSQLVGETVFVASATANAALSDIYARIRDGGFASGNQTSARFLMGLYADEYAYYGTNTDQQQFYNHTLLPANGELTELWNLAYGQIYAANALLNGVQQSQSINEEEKNRFTGEALFIRAYLHFYLVNLFGDVPYIDTTDYKQNAVVSKIPQTQVYQNIIVDLEQAELLLPESYPTDGRVRANKAVVTAMMSRVYLYTEDWQLSQAAANVVISNSLYSVEQSLDQAFLKDSPSIIWSLHPGYAGLNTNDASTFYFAAGPPIKSTLSESFYNAFQPNDLRKEHWIEMVSDGTDSWYRPYKYKNQSVTSASEEYTIILRIEEQYLNRAEAKAQQGDIAGSKEDLNVIRIRAGLPNSTASNQQQVLQQILEERRFEFFSEQGLRWLDLKRTGKADEVLSLIKPNWNPTHILIPIPENELLLNSNLLPQNPGY